MNDPLDDDLHGAMKRVGAYLAERAGMGGKDVIHGYLDGDGTMVVELRASDVLLLVNTMEHSPGVEHSLAAIPQPRREQPARPSQASAGDLEEDRRRSDAAEALLAAWPGELGERVLDAVKDLDAFGALAWKLDLARRDDEDTVALLRGIERTSIQWAIDSAQNPAAFLASRVQQQLRST